MRMRNINLGRSCLPIGLDRLNISELPFEWYDIIIIILLLLTTYQLYKRTGQVVKLVVNDYPRLKEKEKKILYIARAFVFLLVFTIVLFIIEDLFYDLNNFFFVPMKINNEWMKWIKIIKYILVLFLKPLLIYINYRIHGIHSWRFWLTIISSIFFISFLIIFFSNYWKFTIFQEVMAFIVTFSLTSISLGGIDICNMVPRGSKLSQDITDDLVDSDDEAHSKKKRKRANESNVEDNRRNRPIVRPANADAEWEREYAHYLEIWSPEALRDIQYEIKNEHDTRYLKMKLDTVNKTLDDIKSIELKKEPKYKYFQLSILPRWVTLEEAKKIYEAERVAAADRLRELEKNESKENLHMKHRDDKDETMRNQHLDNVRHIVTSEEDHKKDKTRHKKVVSWYLKQKMSDVDSKGIFSNSNESRNNNNESRNTNNNNESRNTNNNDESRNTANKNENRNREDK